MSSLNPAIGHESKDNPMPSGKKSLFIKFRGKSIFLKFAGVLAFLGLWYLGGEWVANNPDTQNFADFAPEPALTVRADA